MAIKSYYNGVEIILFLIILFNPFGACAERRLALVIGNNDYQSVPVLNKAVNDAVAIGQTLQNLGFDVTLKENANQIIMDQAVSEFVLTISEGDIIVFYYAGHGVQLNNSNYLLPIDIKADKGEDVIRNSLELNSLLKKVSNAKAKLSLAIVDACRNNPFQSSATGRGIKKREIGKPRGLTSLTSAPHGVMVIYSAGIDEEALDSLSTDDNNPNGLFTREFIKVIRIPDLTIINIVSKVKQSVKEQAEKVGHQQHPAVYDETDGEFYFLIGPINDNSTISMIEPNKITPSANPSMSNSVDERIFVDPASQPSSVQYKEVANRFRKQTDGTIYDSLLKKRWLMVDGIFEWEAALKQLDSLGVGARLPTRSELQSLLTQRLKPGSWAKLDTHYFSKNGRSTKFWTSDKVGFGVGTWFIDFSNGTQETTSEINGLGIIAIIDN